MSGLFTGLPFNSAYSSFSHLFFFVDDSIIFSKASLQQVEIIKNVIDDYDSILGQEVNFQKSVLYFDKSTSLPTHDSIMRFWESPNSRL